MGTDARELVRELFAAFTAKDADKIASLFTDDGVYHNIPMERVEGPEAIRALVAGWLGQMAAMNFRFEHLVVQGDLVMMERYDQLPGPDGAIRELPVMGVIELRDGRIAAWREYFDLGQMTALGQ